jgi:tRNA threonylcarbamoyladenosine biosynthesis protein TsaB
MNKPLRRLLALDTSTAAMTAALLDGERLLGESAAIAERNHSIYLVPSIVELLKSAGVTMREIDGIGVGVGPGSYTGVRIGVSVAKTLAWTLNVPVIGVSSLEAMALGGTEAAAAGSGASDSPESDSASHESPVWVVPLMNARRGHVYTGLYAIRDGISRCLLPDGNRPLAEWLDKLSEEIAERHPDAHNGGTICFVGETGPFMDALHGPRDWRGWRFTAAETVIRAYDAGRLAARRWLNGEQDDAHTLAPNYTQLAEAEAKFLARRQR